MNKRNKREQHDIQRPISLSTKERREGTIIKITHRKHNQTEAKQNNTEQQEETRKKQNAARGGHNDIWLKPCSAGCPIACCRLHTALANRLCENLRTVIQSLVI